jgi:uncharacterized protein with HEPN domain
MRLEARKYLFDIRQAAKRIARFCANKNRIVWGVVEGDLPALTASLAKLLPDS